MPHLESLGITFLKNGHRVIERGTAKLAIAGVTDPAGRGEHAPDLGAALRGVPRDAVTVLLAHRPQAAEGAAERGVALQLSGHTHGGQYFPFSLLIRFFQPIVAGLHKVGETWLYVSRGTGYWGPPSRLFVGGEITVVTLRRA
ncbi:MAG: metallophosphoesterase [Thermoanaerobaculia bacterium]